MLSHGSGARGLRLYMSRCSCSDAAKRREGPVHSYERKERKPTLAGARYSSSYTPSSSMIASRNSRAVSASICHRPSCANSATN